MTTPEREKYDALSDAVVQALDAGDALAGAAEATHPDLAQAWYACMERIADLQDRFEGAESA